MSSTGAADAQRILLVSAQVRAVARLESQTAPAVLEITPEDVRRGWLEVADPVNLRISSNSRQGYVLNVLPMQALFTSVAVAGLDGEVTLGPDGGELVQRWQQARPVVDVALRFRFQIARGVAPGVYPWPLGFRVRPLENI